MCARSGIGKVTGSLGGGTGPVVGGLGVSTLPRLSRLASGKEDPLLVTVSEICGGSLMWVDLLFLLGRVAGRESSACCGGLLAP